LFEKEYKTKTRRIAIGDAETDFSMFKEVDTGYLVKNIKGGYVDGSWRSVANVKSETGYYYQNIQEVETR